MLIFGSLLLALIPQTATGLPDKPMLPFVTERCPVEYCCPQTWRAQRSTVLFSDWRKNRKPIGRVRANQTIRTVQHVTITRRPGLMRALRDDERVKAGQVIPVYVMHGEGIYSGWSENNWVNVYDSGLECSEARKTPGANFCWERLIVFDWWVEVKTESGQVGWVRQSKYFDVPDSCD
jgi:hypothetical protein